jgi:very-short-patch-repair endonuclease
MDFLAERKKSFAEYQNYKVQHINSTLSMLTPIEQIMYLDLVDLLDEIGARNYRFSIQEKIGKYTVDFLLVYNPVSNPEVVKNIVIECDGHDYHERTKEQAAHDRERDRYFIKNGYILLRYTGSQIVNNRYEVNTDIGEILFGDKEQIYCLE